MKILIIMLFVVLNSSCSTLNSMADKFNEPNLGMTFDSGFNAYQEGHLNDAEKYLLKVVTKNSRHYLAWFLLGNVHYRKGRYDAAVNAYKISIKINDQDERAWYNLALTRIKQANTVLQDGERAIKYDKGQQNKMRILRSKLESRLNIGNDNHVASQ